MRLHRYYVYILANAERRVYVGVTSDPLIRLAQHRDGLGRYTRRHRITRLVHVELFGDAREAIRREKQLKRWPRWRKDALIAKQNPEWDDLAPPPRSPTLAPLGAPAG